MMLNQECVRDLLIYIEQNQPVKSDGHPESSKLMQYCSACMEQHAYTLGDINLAVRYLADKQLIEAGNLNGHTRRMIVMRITATGYDYLGAIRDASRWNTLKQKFGKIFDSSAPVLVEMLLKHLISLG